MESTEKTSKKAVKKGQIVAKATPKTDTSKFYELGYIILPTLTEERALVEERVIMDFFTQKGGELISSEHPTLIDLAYPMLKVIHAHREKCSQGYFGWMKFEVETDAIADIQKMLDASETVLRYMIVKTVRENTLLNGKMNLVKEDRSKKASYSDVEEGEAPEAPMNEEALDKSIDDLVIA